MNKFRFYYLSCILLFQDIRSVILRRKDSVGQSAVVLGMASDQQKGWHAYARTCVGWMAERKPEVIKGTSERLMVNPRFHEDIVC